VIAMHSIEQIKLLLGDTLGLGERVAQLHPQTALLGSLPELDSMTVIQIISGIEERFGVQIDDDEIGADIFETVGSLAAFVDRKLQQ
jgi:acyl carrier protein